MTVTLAQQMVRTVAIFQGLLALPILFVTAGFAMNALGYQSPRLYDFTSVFTLILVASQYTVPQVR
jgi:hypothetical protein